MDIYANFATRNPAGTPSGGEILGRSVSIFWFGRNSDEPRCTNKKHNNCNVPRCMLPNHSCSVQHLSTNHVDVQYRHGLRKINGPEFSDDDNF